VLQREPFAAMAPDGGDIEIWGDGLQTRSFLYIAARTMRQ